MITSVVSGYTVATGKLHLPQTPVFRAGIAAQFCSGPLKNYATTCQTGLFALIFQWLTAKVNSNAVQIICSFFTFS